MNRKKKKKPEAVVLCRQNDITEVTNDRTVVPVELNAETLHGIKPDCSDIPRLLKAILDELIAGRGSK